GDYCDIVSNWGAGDGVKSIFLGTVWKKPNNKFLDRIRFTDQVGGSDQGQDGVGRINNPSNAFILTGISGKETALVYVGSKLQYDLGTQMTKRELPANWFLGDQGSCFCEYWLGYIGEVLIYNKALTKHELHEDISYLHAKWQKAAQ